MLEERYMKIAESMGFDVRLADKHYTYTYFTICHQSSGARIDLSEEKTRDLLNFLNEIRLAAGTSMEERVRKLEEAVFIHPTIDQPAPKREGGFAKPRGTAGAGKDHRDGSLK